MRVLVGLGVLVLLLGCRDSGSTAHLPGAQSSAASSDANAPGASAEEPVFPIVLRADKETLNFHKQAEINTRYADEQICAFMDDMAPALDASRPDGLGCPRDPNPGAK